MIDRVGENLLVDSSTRKGILSVITPSQAREFISDDLAFGSPRPLYIAYVAHDTPAETEDIVTGSDQSRIVSKVLALRVFNETVAKLLVLT